MADRWRKKKAWGKKADPYLLIKAVDVKRPLTSLKSHLFPRGRVNGTVGLPKTPIEDNPVIRGHDLCFDKTCRKTTSRYVRGWLKETVRIITGP